MEGIKFTLTLKNLVPINSVLGFIKVGFGRLSLGFGVQGLGFIGFGIWC